MTDSICSSDKPSSFNSSLFIFIAPFYIIFTCYEHDKGCTFTLYERIVSIIKRPFMTSCPGRVLIYLFICLFEYIWLAWVELPDRKSTRLNSSHVAISYAVFCLKKTKKYN